MAIVRRKLQAAAGIDAKMVYSRRTLFGLVFPAALLMLALSFSAARASLAGLNSRLNALEPRVNEALENPAAASSVISELDTAEGEFEEAANGRASRGELMDTYVQLESMLNRIYQAYQHKKDACIAQIDAGGNCDYDQPEQLALRALYPLSWLHYRGALLYSGDPAMARLRKSYRSCMRLNASAIFGGRTSGAP